MVVLLSAGIVLRQNDVFQPLFRAETEIKSANKHAGAH
jgi:hypothetical protein